MHKTISMSLQGVSYPIEEAAYERLDRYLSRVRRGSRDAAEAEEVAGDIEARMAERLSERLAPGEMVTLDHAEWIVAAIGDPSDLDEDQEQASGWHAEPQGRGRLFKSTDSRMLAGVCGGLATYFGVSAVWVRLAFVLAIALGLVLGGPFWGVASPLAVVAYIAFWVLLPTAAPATSAEGSVPAGQGHIDSRGTQWGVQDSVRAFSSTIARGGREGANYGRDIAARMMGAAREPLADVPAAVAGGTAVAWDASARAIGTTLRVAATVLGVALIAIALAGMATTAVAAISLAADDVPTFVGFYADHVAPFRAANGDTFVAMAAAGGVMVSAVLIGILAMGVQLLRRR